MSIFLGQKKVALLKSDRSVAELYKGNKKIFGYKKATGEVVKINDVHPVKHRLKVKLSNKNLIPYPYVDTTKTVNGITFTDNGDGTITANGTATGVASFFLARNNIVFSDKTYVFSNLPAGVTMQLQYKKANGGDLWVSNGYRTFVWNTENTFFQLYLQIPSGTTLNNVLIKPQLEEGTTPTEFTRGISDFSGIKVFATGKNLFNLNQLSFGTSYQTVYDLAISENGFTFKKLRDSGTSNVNSSIYFKKGTYRISGKVNTSDGLKGGWSVYDNVNKVFIENSSSSGTVEGEFTIEKSGVYQVNFYINYSSPKDVSATYSDVQIEYGTVSTDYEKHNGQEETSTAQGEVTGLISTSPEMIVFANADGVITECKYV